LYTIVILHTGDKEDWALYDRFLTSCSSISRNGEMGRVMPFGYLAASLNPSNAKRYAGRKAL